MISSLCAEVARELGEPLAGTAAHAPFVVAIEETGAWAPNPIESPGIAHLRSALERILAELPQSRLQLIRQPTRCEPRRRLYVAATTGPSGVLTQHELSDEELVSIDPATLLADATPADPIYLVCTHGKRDRCCALEGTAYFRALESQEGVWMTSHLGGHRFAATMLCLPSGLCYGRLSVEHAQLDALPPALLRGRVAYEAPVQSAEIEAMQHGSPSELVFEDFDRETSLVRFRSDGSALKVRVTRREQAPRVVSCGEPAKAVVSWSAKIEQSP